MAQELPLLTPASVRSALVISAEDLEQLPVDRSTLGAVTLLAPGVSRGDTAFTGTSFSGSSVAENTSFINGLNTTQL